MRLELLTTPIQLGRYHKHSRITIVSLCFINTLSIMFFQIVKQGEANSVTSTLCKC